MPMDLNARACYSCSAGTSRAQTPAVMGFYCWRLS
jgi:hypothetical protein